MRYVKFNILAELRKSQRGQKTKPATATLLHILADDYLAPKKK